MNRREFLKSAYKVGGIAALSSLGLVGEEISRFVFSEGLSVAEAANPGSLYGSLLGPQLYPWIENQATYAMAALNTGWSARFIAKKTNNVVGVRLFWSAVSSPGTLYLGIETDSAGSGVDLPSGTLYDANATQSITPAANGQTYTFSPAPTAGLTIGSTCHVVLITTVAGTTQTLASHYSAYGYFEPYPSTVLTAANGTTRTNFAEVNTSSPVCSLVLDDGTEEVAGFTPFWGVVNATNIYGSNIAAQQITTKAPISVVGIVAVSGIYGSLNGNLVLDIRNASSNVEYTGAVSTIPYTSLGHISFVTGKFNAPITLPAGTWNVTIANSGGDSTHAYRIAHVPFLNSACTGAFRYATSSNLGTSWTVSTTDVAGIWLLVDSDVTPSSGGGGGF